MNFFRVEKELFCNISFCIEDAENSGVKILPRIQKFSTTNNFDLTNINIGQLKSRNKTNFPFKHIFVSFTVTRFKDTFLMEEYAPLFRGKSSSSKKIVAP